MSLGEVLKAHTLSGSDALPTEGLTGGSVGMGPLDRILTTVEKREILGALKRANGQRTLAARILGISRSRLYRRMEALEIDPRDTSELAELSVQENT